MAVFGFVVAVLRGGCGAKQSTLLRIIACFEQFSDGGIAYHLVCFAILLRLGYTDPAPIPDGKASGNVQCQLFRVD
jgi:hypothetical protein